MTRRPRGLKPEENELWKAVAATAHPLHPERPKTDAAAKAEMAKPRKVRAALAEFKVGSAAPARPGRADLAPAIEDRMAAQPVKMDKRKHQRMTRGKLGPESRIDLHGMTLAEAHPALIRFIVQASAAGQRLVLVITGKGKRGDDDGPIPRRVGQLRHQVPHWLSSPPLSALVLQVATAHQKHGGSGAYYVYLRRGA